MIQETLIVIGLLICIALIGLALKDWLRDVYNQYRQRRWALKDWLRDVYNQYRERQRQKIILHRQYWEWKRQKEAKLASQRPVIRPVITKTYIGTQAEATKRFQTDCIEMASHGFFPTSQSWAPGQWSAGAFIIALLLCFILIGIVALIYMLIVKPDGTLTVTYERRTVVEEKTCPRCAERIKAAALVCHFCGHEFAPEEVKTSSDAPVLPMSAADHDGRR